MVGLTDIDPTNRLLLIIALVEHLFYALLLYFSVSCIGDESVLRISTEAGEGVQLLCSFS